MFHDDLSLYLDKEFRSSFYIENCWKTIEESLLFYIGTIKDIFVTIYFEADIIQIVISKDEKIIYQELFKKNFFHSLNHCDDFIVSVIIKSKAKSENKLNQCTYSYAKNTGDEGIVEMFYNTDFSISNYKKIKKHIFYNLCLEIQYAINRNIFLYNINGKDKKADVDSYYELIKSKNNIENKNFLIVAKEMLKNNIIEKDIYDSLCYLQVKLGEINE